MHSVHLDEYKNLTTHLNSTSSPWPSLYPHHSPHPVSSPSNVPLYTLHFEAMNPFKNALEKCFRSPSSSSNPSKSHHLSSRFRHFLSISPTNTNFPQTQATSSFRSYPDSQPQSWLYRLHPLSSNRCTLSQSPQQPDVLIPPNGISNDIFCMTGGIKRKHSSPSFGPCDPIASCLVHAFAPLKRPRKEKMVRLLDLSNDLLMTIMTHVMTPAKEGSRRIITEESIRASLPLAQTCHTLYDIWRNSMRDLELWVSGKLSDRGLTAICKGSGRNIHRLGLRRCTQISKKGFSIIYRTCTRLRSIDLSHTDITDDFILQLTKSTGRTLQILAVHGCSKLTSLSLRIIADRCPHLRFLDVGSIPAVDDASVSYLVQKLGGSLRTMVLSNCKILSDATMAEIGTHCKSLMSLTIRGLPLITDAGLQRLCSGIGDRVQILDVLDCTGLTMGGYFATMEAYCPHVFRYLEESNYVDHLGERCLQDNIIATMPGLIYRISATDAIRRLPALYFLLLDESTLRPFRVSVQSKSLNLSDFGTVLISNFGKRPTQKTRNVLLTRFGYDSPFDSESDDESCD